MVSSNTVVLRVAQYLFVLHLFLFLMTYRYYIYIYYYQMLANTNAKCFTLLSQRLVLRYSLKFHQFSKINHQIRNLCFSNSLNILLSQSSDNFFLNWFWFCGKRDHAISVLDFKTILLRHNTDEETQEISQSAEWF